MKERRMTKISKMIILFGISLACVCALAGCTGTNSESASEDATVATYADIENMDLIYTDRDKDASYDEAQATKILLEGQSAQAEGAGVQVEGSLITINAAGTYLISGELTDGQIRVSLPETDKAQLVLAGASIHNETGAALYVEQADKCFVTLAADTENELSDGANYRFAEGEDEPDATLFSKDDLTLNGTGALAVTANYSDAIASKDDLTITGGSYTISATEDGLRGKDSLKILEGTFDIEAGEDCLKSSRDDDPARGFVCVDGGTFELNAGDDAIHAETYLRVTKGDITIPTCNEGLEAMVVQVDDGTIQVTAEDDALNAAAPSAQTDQNAAEEAFASAPGNSQGRQDEQQERQMPQRPNDQNELETPPDLPSGDRVGSPENGEGQQLTMKGEQGRQRPNANNAQGKFGPGGAEDGNENCKIIINGGTLTLAAKGDAIDSNGSLAINGGALFVTGPTSNGDGALDYALSAECNGGTILIVGSAGMAQDFSSASQPSAFVQARGSAGQKVIVADQTGAELFSYTPSAAFETAIVSSPDLVDDQEYSLIIGDTITSFTAATR